MKTRAVMVGATVLLAGAGAWFGVNGASRPSMTEDKAPGEVPVLNVSVVAARWQSLADDIRVIGTLVPREKVVVLSDTAGLRVRAVYAETGDHVRKGQRLALLDGESLDIQRQSLQADFDRTRDEYARFKALESSDATSKESVQQRQAAYELARAKLRDAQLSIERTQIVAPTDGFIYERTATIGGLTSATDPLFRIAQGSEVEMEANVPEALVRRLRPGMPVMLTVAGEGTPVPGQVRLVMPLVDTTSRAASVRIRFDRARSLSVGVFCEASITAGKLEGWMLPGTALQQDAQGAYVWSVGPERTVARQTVTVVARTADGAVIKESLGDAAIVAKAGSFLKAGDLVAVANQLPSSKPAKD